MSLSIKFTPFSELDRECLMPLADFVECCECGGFTSYDGFGFFATACEMSDRSVDPDEIREAAHAGGYQAPDTRFTHVVWYNR